MKLWRLDWVCDVAPDEAMDGSRFYVDRFPADAAAQAMSETGYLCDVYWIDAGELLPEEIEALTGRAWPQLSTSKILEQINTPMARAKRQLAQMVVPKSAKKGSAVLKGRI